LDSVQHIFNAVLYLAHLLFQQRERGVFPILQLHDFCNDGINHGIVLNQLHGFSYDQIFQPLFTDGLFLAGLETLRGGALIIMMNDLVSTRAALAEHHRAAYSAEQLGGEQVIVLGLVAGRSTAVLFDFQLHFLKQILVHDGRDAVGHYDVLEVVFSDVTFVRQQLLNTVIHQNQILREHKCLLWQKQKENTGQKKKCLRFRRWDSGNRITCRQCNHNLKKHSDNCKNRGIFIGANEFHQRIHLPQVIWVYIKYRENKKYAWQHKNHSSYQR